jgi:hypothetical protein
VVIALLLTSSAGIEVMPLIIVAAVVSYILVDVLETAFAPPAPKVLAAPTCTRETSRRCRARSAR